MDFRTPLHAGGVRGLPLALSRRDRFTRRTQRRPDLRRRAGGNFPGRAALAGDPRTVSHVPQRHAGRGVLR